MSLEIKVTGTQRVKAMVALLKVTPAKRKNILRKVARKAKTLNAKRRREQKDLDGKPFKSRKKGTAKMFTKLVRKFRHTASNVEAKLYFLRNAGLVAYAHQHGIGDRFNPKKDGDQEKKNKGETAFNQSSLQQPATKAQAKRLIETGEFRIGKRRTRNGKTVNGGKGRIPTIRWITQNLTKGQAGAIYRSVRKTQPNKTWTTERPKRAWLGMNKQDTEQATNIIIDELATQIS